MSQAIAEAAKPAVGFAGLVVTAGALLSLLVPTIPADARPGGGGGGGEASEDERALSPSR